MAANLATTLITKLTVSNVLDGEDIRAINRLPIRQREFAAGEVVVADGQRPKECCLVAEGFLFRSKTTLEGNRQVLSVHIPGEIPDLHSLHLHVIDHDLTALTPSILGFIPHDALNAINVERPNLVGAFWRETLVDSAIFREWIVNLGRRSAVPRMAHLILELHRRLEAIGRTRNGTFEMPVTQSDLADCLGLSAVHVNRVLQELRHEGLMDVNRTVFRIIDAARLEQLAGFDPTYLHLHPNV